MQASLLATTALTVEVDTLKQNLERSEQELGLAKKQLEDKEGEEHHFKICTLQKRILVAIRMTRIPWVLQGPLPRWLP